MPGPLSVTDSLISPPSAIERHANTSAWLSSSAEYLMALSTMLDSAWPISSRLPVNGEAARTRALERHADLLGRRLVELDHVAHGGSQVDLG